MIFYTIRDIDVIGFNHLAECSAWVDKYFSYYVIQYAERGELDLFIDNQPVRKLCGPVVWLTFPGPYFKFGRRDGGCWHHRFVSFKGPLAERYAQTGMFPTTKTVIQINEPEKFGSSFDLLLQRLARNDGVDLRTVHLLEELLLQLSEQPEISYEPPPSVATICRIATDIKNNPTAERNWRETAKAAGMSYPHFRKTFHDVLKMPPARFLLQKRLEMSAAMLRSSDNKLGAISLQCGLYDEFHYSKLFKKYYGMSPGQYRRNHRLS